MGYSGAWGKLIHEKKPKMENLAELSLQNFEYMHFLLKKRLFSF
jgi:hypothetical protein